jgi:hypothetical protein
VGTKFPVCKLPFTLKEYHAWFSLPELQPSTTSLPVMRDKAAWIAASVYLLVLEGVIPAFARAPYVSNPYRSQIIQSVACLKDHVQGRDRKFGMGDEP